MDAITAAAVQACDGLDGVEDGVISRNDLCEFDANTAVGQEVTCDTGGNFVGKDASNMTTYKAKISSGAAIVMNLAWQGSTSAKDNLNTTAPSGPVAPWSFVGNVTSRENYDEVFRLSLVTFNNWLETSAVDLDDFRQRGGKLLTWHGGNDQIIVPNGTVDYYERVLARDRSFQVQTYDYYRLFEAPGLPHCTVGPGPLPRNVLDSLVRWVEEGDPPDTLTAESGPDESGQGWKRPLCLYPKHQVWNGNGDPHDAAGWTCESGTSVVSARTREVEVPTRL